MFRCNVCGILVSPYWPSAPFLACISPQVLELCYSFCNIWGRLMALSNLRSLLGSPSLDGSIIAVPLTRIIQKQLYITGWLLITNLCIRNLSRTAVCFELDGSVLWVVWHWTLSRMALLFVPNGSVFWAGWQCTLSWLAGYVQPVCSVFQAGLAVSLDFVSIVWSHDPRRMASCFLVGYEYSAGCSFWSRLTRAHSNVIS